MIKIDKVNQLIITTGIVLAVAATPITVYAQVTTSSGTTRIRTEGITTRINATHSASQPTQTQQLKITDLKTRADKAIDARIASLNMLISKITNAQRLSSTTKNLLTSQVQTYITNLTALKSKIDTDTDITTLRIDVQSIIQAYRVYAFFMPEMTILSTANAILATTDKISSLSSQLQTHMKNAQSHGQDITGMQNAFTDLGLKVADANTQAQSAVTSLTGLTPTGFPSNKTTLQTARSYIIKARQDVEAAIKDIHIITQTSKEVPHTSATPSAIPATK